MNPPPGEQQPSKSYTGARYFREFISKVRKDQDAGKYEHLEDYPYDILVDEDLGLRLYHAGINPYDQEHFRHQLYLVVTDSARGKASKLCAANTIVASALTLQWTKRGDLCNALLLSVKSFGQCTFAWCGDGPSRSKCGWCGHNTKTLVWRANAWNWTQYRRGRVLGQGEKHCCKFNPVVKKYHCCRCNDPDNAFMSPLDREEAAVMPQCVLPATIKGHEQYVKTTQTQAALANRSPTEPSVTRQPAVNNFHIYGNILVSSGAIASDWGLSPASLTIGQMPIGLIGFTSDAVPSLGHGQLPASRVVEDLGDVPGGIGSGGPRKYVSPKVEDDVEEVANRLAARLSGIEIDKTRR